MLRESGEESGDVGLQRGQLGMLSSKGWNMLKFGVQVWGRSMRNGDGDMCFLHVNTCSEINPEMYVGGIMSPHFIPS